VVSRSKEISNGPWHKKRDRGEPNKRRNFHSTAFTFPPIIMKIIEAVYREGDVCVWKRELSQELCE
jgi:hypothetical protein